LRRSRRHACGSSGLNETIVARTQDPSALHQARVAMRRLRSAFTLFRPIIGDQEFPTLREEVRWFTNQLGDARNLDVILKRIPSAKDANSSQAELRRTLEAARERAYAAVLDALASPRLRRLMLDLVGWIEVGTWREAELAQRPIGSSAGRSCDRRWRKVKKGGKNLATLEWRRSTGCASR
jgi:CHAD domain-containing protein